MPDKVRMLLNRRALIFICGKQPIIDLKYDLKRHPNYKCISGAGKPPYEKNFDPSHYEKINLSYGIDLENWDQGKQAFTRNLQIAQLGVVGCRAYKCR